MKILRSLAASAAVLSAAVTAQVQAADVTLKFGHVGASLGLYLRPVLMPTHNV
jgi:hypothetical protein